MKDSALKLKIDLVPETCWHKNLRKQMRQSQWDKLRKKVYGDQGNVCGICGAKGKLNCHEFWNYDEKRLIQKLMGFQAVCKMCHLVTHFGLTEILGAQGHLDVEAVIKHFMKVNRVNRAVFESHKTEAFRAWRERSMAKWRTDLSEWASLIEQKTNS
jgi:hypothetical protein